MKSKYSNPLIISFFTSILTLSIFNILVFLSMRPFWYFINRDTKTPFIDKFPFSTLLFSIYTGYFIYCLILFIVLINKQKKITNVNFVIPIILGVLLSAITIYLFTRMEGSEYLVTSYLKSPTPYLLTIMLFFLLVFFSPTLKISQRPIFYYSAIAVAIILLLLKIMDFGNVKITSGPNVQAIDNNSIAILWTTNKNSTSYVEYGPDKDHLKTAFMSTNGLIDANTKYHKVVIAAPVNISIIYRVLSTKINHSFQNNVNYGNTTVSSFKKYDLGLKDKLVFYTLNDVHENKDIYKKFLSKSDYDFVVLNGDTVNTIDSTSDIIFKFLKPLSTATNGEKPFYFVSGNHEPRGGSARDLPNYLALPNNRYYYTFSFGSIFAVVLDSGEDKLDTDNEYSGLADFENYRKLQTKWLQDIYKSDAYKNAKYKICFVHIPLNIDSNIGVTSLEPYQVNWRDLLNKMEIDVVFSGHTHFPTVIAPDNSKYNFPTIIGGGPTENQEEYVAIRTEVTEYEMKIFFVSFDGVFTEVYTVPRH